MSEKIEIVKHWIEKGDFRDSPGNFSFMITPQFLKILQSG